MLWLLLFFGSISVALLAAILGCLVLQTMDDQRRLQIIGRRLQAEERMEMATRQTLRAMRAAAMGPRLGQRHGRPLDRD